MSPENRRNYYRVLQVQPDAPPEVIKASYRTLMQKLRHHPDLGGDEWNAALINEAYAVLSNAVKRAAYDRTQPHLFQNIGKAARDDGAYARSAAKPNAAPAPAPAVDPDVAATPAQRTPTDGLCCPFCGAANPSGNFRQQDFCSRCHATLKPVLASGNSPGRTASRIEHAADMQFVLSWPPKQRYAGKVVDLSPTGMQFVSRQQLRTKQRVMIESAALAAVAEVSRCTVRAYAQEYETGVKFLTLSVHRKSGTFVSKTA